MFLKGVFQYDKENYITLSRALPEVAQELEQINSIEIDNITYPIEKKLGGDLKNLAILLGIVAANGKHACLWCHCNLKANVNIEKEYKIERTQKTALAKFSKKELGYFNEPIFKFIEFKDVTIDMLHLHLRITDKLFNCLTDKLTILDENNEQDQISMFKKLDSFLLVNCNITNPLVYDQVGRFEIKFRTLNDKERVIIFEKLFENGKHGFDELFANFIFNEEHNFQIENFVWNEFRIIYNKIRDFDKGMNIDEFDMVDFKESLKKWLYFYKKVDIMENTSPYMHAFVYHMPEFLEKHGSINLFNCQGLEKLNDISTKFYHNSTNKNKQDNNYLVQLIKKMNRMEVYNFEENLDELFQLV